MRNAFLIPKRGLVVRDPLTLSPLPAEGATVRVTTYWTRRINAKDVTEGRAPSKTTKPAAKGGNQE